MNTNEWNTKMSFVETSRSTVADKPCFRPIANLTLLRLTVAILGTAIKHPVPDRVKPSFVIFHVRALWRSGLSVRVPGCQNLKSLECKGYSALRSAVMTEFLDIGWRKNSIIRLLAKWKFGTVDRHPSSDRRTSHRLLMKTSTQLSHCCWVRKTILRATEQ